MVANVQSVVRAMSILAAFGADGRRLTLAEVARRVQLPRGTVHRLLATFEELGYVRSDAGVYELTHRVLDLGYSYLSSQPLPDLGRSLIYRLSDEVDEHASVGIIDGTDVLVVAAAPLRRQIAVLTRVGSRLPLADSASGRALLSETDESAAADLCTAGGAGAAQIDALLLECARARDRGFAVSDETLEVGLTSIAAPVRGAGGEIIAAVAVATPKARYDVAALEASIAPRLVTVAEELGRGLRHSL